MRQRLFGLMTYLVISFFICQTVFASGMVLQEGATGEAVKTLQTKLIQLEYLQGKPSGIYDKQTAEAVMRFQRDRNIDVDGVYGPQTQAELKKKNLKKAPEAAKETEVREKKERDEARKKAKREQELYEKAIRTGKPVFVSATAYSAHDPGNSPYTASGTLVRHGIIAVDPSFIPIGTHVYIPGYGEAIAEDTGGAIMGNIIDIAFDTHEEAILFGCQDLEIYILDSPL